MMKQFPHEVSHLELCLILLRAQVSRTRTKNTNRAAAIVATIILLRSHTSVYINLTNVTLLKAVLIKIHVL